MQSVVTSMRGMLSCRLIVMSHLGQPSSLGLGIMVQQDGFPNLIDLWYDALDRSAEATLGTGRLTLRSNAFASTILKIFCTFMECDVEQNICDNQAVPCSESAGLTIGACMAFENFLACFVISS